MSLAETLVEDVLKLIQKARDMERKALRGYRLAMRYRKMYGELSPEFVKVIRRLALETLFHLYLMEALLTAHSEWKKLFKEFEEEAIGRNVNEDELYRMIAEFAELHLRVEKEAIDLYTELAWTTQNRLINKIALALAENEGEHHSLLRRISSIVKG